PDAQERFLMEGHYPKPGPPLPADLAREMEVLVEVVSRIRQVRGELDLPPQSTVRLAFPTAAAAWTGRHRAALRTPRRAAEPTVSDAAPSSTTSMVQAAGWALAVDVDDPNLLRDEIRRLEKHLGKLEKDLSFVAKRLENPQFSERARPEIVSAERDKHAR